MQAYVIDLTSASTYMLRSQLYFETFAHGGLPIESHIEFTAESKIIGTQSPDFAMHALNLLLYAI